LPGANPQACRVFFLPGADRSGGAAGALLSLSLIAFVWRGS
jgi:hypothetical protein